MIAKELSMHARPDQTAIGINIDLRHAQFRGGQILVFIYTTGGRIQLAAGGIDPLA